MTDEYLPENTPPFDPYRGGDTIYGDIALALVNSATSGHEASVWEQNS